MKKRKEDVESSGKSPDDGKLKTFINKEANGCNNFEEIVVLG